MAKPSGAALSVQPVEPSFKGCALVILDILTLILHLV